MPQVQHALLHRLPPLPLYACLPPLQLMGVGSSSPEPVAAGAGPVAAGSPSPWRELLQQPAQEELGSAAVTGLSNEAGEYNCFLNVIVQCLWRCADFRAQVGDGPCVGCRAHLVARTSGCACLLIKLCR